MSFKKITYSLHKTLIKTQLAFLFHPSYIFCLSFLPTPLQTCLQFYPARSRTFFHFPFHLLWQPILLMWQPILLLWQPKLLLWQPILLFEIMRRIILGLHRISGRPDMQLAGYSAFFGIWYPAGYPVSLAGYPGGWLPDIRLDGYRIFCQVIP